MESSSLKLPDALFKSKLVKKSLYFLIFQEMELSGPMIKKLLIFSEMEHSKNVLYFRKYLSELEKLKNPL